MQNNLKIIIDPTHGGIDYGIESNGIYEKDLVLELSKYINNRLNDLGIPSILTRTIDKTLSPDERINLIKQNVGDEKNVLIISNGLNATYKQGADIIYQDLKENTEIIKIIKQELENTGLNPINIYSKTNLEGLIDESLLQQAFKNATVLIIDYGNLFNTSGQINKNLYNYGEAIVKAIANYNQTNYQENSDFNQNTYIVKKGESLYSIANKYGLSVNDLKRLNNLSSTKLDIGQIIKLPKIINDNINRYFID